MALRKRIGKIGVSCTLALAVMASGAFLSSNTKVYAEPLPATYQIDISPFEVGDQGSSALCWAYSSSKVLETFVYSSFAPNESITLNLSEEWLSLAYLYYVNDFDNNLVTTGYAKDNTDYQYGQTGTPFFFERVVNAYGIVLEEDYTYTGPITNANYQTVFNEYKSKAKKDIVEDVEFSWIASNQEVQKNYSQEAIVNKIKSLILVDNAVYTGIVSVSGKGTETPYVWHDTSDSLGHAMTIIGYDDNKVVTVDGDDEKTGAFVLLNSYGDNDQIVYMPYEMFSPNLQESGESVREMNNVISNTFFIQNAKQVVAEGGEEGEGNAGDGTTGDGNTGTGDGDSGTDGEGSGNGDNAGAGEEGEGNAGDGTTGDGNTGAGDGNSSTDGEGSGNGDNAGAGEEGEGETEEGGETVPEETLSFWESIMAKTTEEKVFMGVAVGVVAIFLFIGIGFLISAGIRRRQTKSINQQVLAHNFAKYQSHRMNLEKQKQELDEELQKIREEQKRKKQRRLKRQFNKNLNTGGSGGNNDNINL